MNDKDLLELYFSEYKKSFFHKAEELHSIIRNGDRDSSPEAFCTIFAGLSLYYSINEGQIKKSIVDGDCDYGIDAIYLPTELSSDNIGIFDFKLNSSLEYSKIKEFIDNIEKYVLHGTDLPRSGNPQLLDRLRDLHSFLEQRPDVKIDIIIYREGEINSSKKRLEENKLQEIKLKYDRVANIRILSKTDVLNLLLHKLWYEGNIYSKSYDGFLLNFNKEKVISHNAELFLMVVSLYDLLLFIHKIELLNFDVTNNRKYDIFKLNVRKKTDASKVIRTNILDTVTKNPEKFIKYHNGITIACEKFDILSEKIQFYQPQIVNGCQTISGLYEEFRVEIGEYLNIITNQNCSIRSKDDVITCLQKIERLKQANILIKVTTADTLSDEPKNISRFANSQTQVKAKDLLVNNVEQLIIGSFLGLNGFNYFRKDGQEFDTSRKMVSLEQLYKFMYGYIYLNPSRGKNDLNTILFQDDTLYKKLFPGIFSLDDILKIAEFYKKVTDFKKRNPSVSKYYYDFIVFGLFLVYKEGGNTSEIKPNTIREILDDFVETKKSPGFSQGDLFLYIFQRRSFEIVSFLVGKLESKYGFILDRNKFDSHREEFSLVRKKILNDKYSDNQIHYKGFILNKLNEYLEEKNTTGKQLKNMIWIIIDIVSENPGILTDDLLSILKIFYSFYKKNSFINSPNFIQTVMNNMHKNSDKISEIEGALFLTIK